MHAQRGCTVLRLNLLILNLHLKRLKQRVGNSQGQDTEDRRDRMARHCERQTGNRRQAAKNEQRLPRSHSFGQSSGIYAQHSQRRRDKIDQANGRTRQAATFVLQLIQKYRNGLMRFR